MSDSDKKQVYKPKPITGFPEWLPEERLVEQQWFDHIRRVFESYGFCSIETPSVEELDVLRAKGEVDKEIYVIERLHKEEGDKDARLALHFDQTVPLARYVAQRFNDLVFPFKRYQMQRVWRGERPQAGRFREFYQCDIDVINVDSLPLHFDAEMPAIIWEVLTGLPGMENEKIQLRINNRKLITSLVDTYTPRSSDIQKVLSLIDKMEKIGTDQVRKELKDNCGFQSDKIDEFIKHVQQKFNTAEELEVLNSTEALAKNPRFFEGLNDLKIVMRGLSHLPQGAVVADLSIVRGLDYYTGTVYETVFVNDPSYGSICSGGRYDDLASSYINKHLPGVGISIGFSRLFSRLLQEKKLPVGPKTPAKILMILDESDTNGVKAKEMAHQLRKRGYNVELYPGPAKIKKQMSYAERKGIPYVWFPDVSEVKDMATGTQMKADPKSWNPDGQSDTAKKPSLFQSLITVVRKLKWIPAFAGMTLLMMATTPSYAGETVYSPPGCDFQITFPEEPHTVQRCNERTEDSCQMMNGYTKVFDLDATINFYVSCNPSTPETRKSFTTDILRTSLLARPNVDRLEGYDVTLDETADATMGALLGAGPTPNGNDVMLYVAQIWVGNHSILSLEGELIGNEYEAADKLFADILRSLKVKETSPPAEDAKEESEEDDKPEEEKPAP